MRVNLFRLPTELLGAELVERIVGGDDVLVERIVSTGQATPADKPCEQDHDEWVLLLTGSASLWIDEDGERMLRPGDHVLIPARRRHRVTWTVTDEPTVWLAVHFS